MTRCGTDHEWAGWWCSRDRGHPGPCALRPRWWNVPVRIRIRIRRATR